MRFKGFNEFWSDCKLHNLAFFNPKADLPENFEYVDLESVIGTELTSHRPESKKSAPSRAQRLAKSGDLFYQTVRPYQRNNYLYNLKFDNFVFSTGYAQMRPQGDAYFLLSLVQNNQFVKTVMNNCTGTSYPAINSTDLSNLNLTVSLTIEEQTKIGELFKNLDTLINQHQTRVAQLANVKKSMLDKMFAKAGADVPEVRFEGKTKNWIYYKLGSIGMSTSGTSIESEFIEQGSYKVISIGSYSEDSTYTDQNIRVNLTKKTQNRILNENDLTMILNDKTASGNIIGRVLLIDQNNTYVYNQRTQRIEPFMENFAPIYLYQMLNAPNIRNNIIKQSQGNTQIYVNWSTIKSIKYPIPEIEEQTKIGQFFKNLDTLIAQHQKALEQLKNLKQALLHKMFV